MPGRTTTVAFLGSDADLRAVADRVAAKLRQTSTIAEETNAKMAASSEAAAGRMGKAFDEGTNKAGGALHKLGQLGASWGVPFSQSLDNIGKKLDEATTRSGKLHESLAALGKVTLVGGLAGFAAAAYEGVKGAASLQRQMEMLHTQAGATQAEVGKMTGAVLNMAGSVGTGPQQLAEALYHIESAGIRGGDAIKVLKAAAEGAKVGNANLTDVTNALNAAVVSGISGVQSYQQAMGVLNATVGAGDMKMQDLAEALGTGGLLSIAKNLGVGIKDVGASLAVFGDVGIRGADASTKLKQALLGMAAPTSAQAKYLSAIGMSTLQMANDLRSGGIIGALSDLKRHMEASGATASQQALVLARIFDKRSLGGVETLLSGLDRLKAKYQEIGSGANKFGSSVAATHHTLAFQMDQLKATVQALADKFGLFLIPKLQATAHAISDVIGWFGRHKAAAEALAGVIVGVLGAAVTTFAVSKAAAFVGGIRSMIGAMGLMGTAAKVTAGEVDVALGSTGIGAIMIALGIAATEMGSHWQNVMYNMKSAVNWMVQAAETALNGLISALNAAISVFNSTIGQVTGQIGAVNKVGVGGPFNMNAPDTSLNAAGTADILKTGNVGVPAKGSNWQRIAGALAGQGFSNTVIAGILGNFAQETGGGTVAGINTRDSGTGASGMGGMGIAQWTAGRRTVEMQYAAQHHESPTSLTAQIGYLVQELRTSYHNVYAAMSKATSAAAAAAIFDKSPAAGGFEGGTDPGGVREKVAAQVYQMLTGSSSPTAGGSAGRGGAGNAAIQSLIDANTKGKSTAAKKVTYGPSQNVLNMLQMAQELVGAPYSKAGHASAYNETVAQIKKFGTDCSGLVSVLLKEGVSGIRAAQNTATLPTSAGLAPGAGKYVTVYDRNTGPWADQHTLIEILGKYFESGGNSRFNPSGGVSQLTSAQAAGELAGGGFNLFHPTASYLNQAVAGAKSSAFSFAAAQAAIQQAIDAFIAGLTKAATALISTYQNLEQSGTVKTLTKALGVSTAGQITSTHTGWLPPAFPGADQRWGTTTTQMSVAGALQKIVEGISTGSVLRDLNAGNNPSAIDKLGKGGITSLLAKSENASPQGKQFNQLVASLIAAGQKQEAAALVAAHKAAMATLAQELYAEQVTKDGELLNLQATQLKDQTTLQANSDAQQLVVAKAQQQQVIDAMNAQVTAIKDMTQTVQDQFAGIVQAIQDATQAMADNSDAVVAGIQDTVQTRVDILGERGLYGLNLIAQQQTVQLDQMRAGFDQQIAAAKQNLDQVTASVHQQESIAQLNLDQVTTQQDQLVAMAQQGADTVAVKQNLLILAAQQHMDAVTLHEDTAVLGPAQMAVDLGATLPKAQQDVLNGILKKAQGTAGVAEAGAAQQYQNVYDTAQQAMSDASNWVNAVTANANAAIGAANQTLVSVTGAGNAAIATAQQGVQTIQDTAAQAEAAQQGVIDITKAQASTQFAGSGFTVNIYGAPIDNAAAIADAFQWQARQLLPTG